ncbi:hypothetical protein HYX10_04680 [Candidatus Woesearchaeota archaeon]|nr:hypothetical protein [Candidatus Woesearchaeota archaeon]
MEKDYLLTATQGKGILIMDNDHQELEVVASPKEHELITTNPNEIVNKHAKPEELADINAAVDLEKKLYYARDLDIEQKNYLGNHGYKAGFFVPIGKPRQEECWVKANEVESLEHTFLVENIKSELLKHTKEVVVNVAVGPDIIFKDKRNRSIALEIETGKSLREKKRLQEKFHEAKLKYQNLVLIVLTDVHQKQKYEKIVEDIPLLLRKDIPHLIETLFKKKKQA